MFIRKNQNLININGFTFIETIIYIAILSLVVGGFISFAMSISDIKEKSYVVQEVNANGRMVLNILTQKIKSAKSIKAPSFGNSSDYLSLDMGNQPDVSFGVYNGIFGIFIEGNSATTTLTSNVIDVTNLVFTNLAVSNQKGNIKVEIQFKYKNTDNIIYTYDNSWQTAVNIRR